MPKRMTKPKVTTPDQFSDWLQTLMPDGVRLRVLTYRTFERDRGSVHAYLNVDVTLSKGARSLQKDSHNLAALASWVTAVALPDLCPPPVRPMRKITIERPKLEHRPITTVNDLFD